MNSLRTMISSVALVIAVAGLPARADTVVYSRPLTSGAGPLRNSCLWVDPSGENDSDNDSIAWTDFQLTQAATITRVRWWGQALPPLGFRVRFYNQDPNTVAVQPHIVGAGAGPLSTEYFTNPEAVPVGGGLYEFTVDLANPMAFEADTRYFLSVVGLTPSFAAQWGWAQGDGPGWTFWWNRGMAMYFLIGGGRAMELEAEVCLGDVDVNGAVEFADLLALLGAWGPCTGCAADLDGSGDVGFTDLTMLLSAWGPCP